MFKWFRNLFRRDRITHVQVPPYRAVVNNTEFPDETIAEVFPDIADDIHRQRELINETMRIQGIPQIIIPHETPQDNFFGGVTQTWQGQAYIGGQQGLTQQQMANQQAFAEQNAFAQGTYGQLRQQQTAQAWQGQGLMFGDTYQTFLMELKANGMPEPELKEDDLLAPDIIKIADALGKLSAFMSGPNKNFYYKIYDTLKHLNKELTLRYTGEWGYDEELKEYLIKTSWSGTQLPLNCFIKLPGTLEECIEVMEKGLWSSRKLPITKKDIQ